MLDRLKHSSTTPLILWAAAHTGALISLITKFEPSASYVALSVAYGVLLAVSSLGLWVAVRDGGQAWRRIADRWTLRPTWLAIIVVVLAMLWVLPLEPAYPINALRWLITADVVVVCAGLRVPTSWGRTFRTIVILTLLGVALCVNTLTLHGYPKAYVDEGISLNKAWSGSAEGIIYTPSINLGVRGVPQVVNTEWVWWAVGIWTQLTGLGVFQGRISAWLCWFLTTALTVLAARRLYGREAAVIAGLFVGASEIALYTSHYVRPEMYLNAVIALSLVFYAQVERRGRFRDAVLLGLVISLGVGIHVNALIYCFGYGVLYTVRYLVELGRTKRLLVDRRWWGLVLGGLIGLIIYAGLYILPDISAFRQQAQFYYGINYGEAAISHSLAAMISSHVGVVINHFRVWYAASVPEASVVIFAAAAVLLVDRKRSLVAILVLALLAWILLGSYPALTYVSNLLPIAAILVGAGVTAVFAGSMSFAVTAILITSMLGVTTSKAVTGQQDRFNQRFETCIATLSHRLPAHAMILGDPLFWLARPTLTNYGTKDLIDNPWPGRTVSGWWAWINPDIVLWPGPLSGGNADYVIGHGYQQVNIPECHDVAFMWVKPGVQF